MSHTCRALVIHCIDFRFQKAIREFLAGQGLLGDCDILSIAGITKGLVGGENEPSFAYILNQIDISHRLHGISEVVLFHHTDCGAYGGSKSFTSMTQEKNKYLADMIAAEAIITAKYPEVKVKKMIANLGEEIIFEEVEQ